MIVCKMNIRTGSYGCYYLGPVDLAIRMDSCKRVDYRARGIPHL